MSDTAPAAEPGAAPSTPAIPPVPAPPATPEGTPPAPPITTPPPAAPEAPAVADPRLDKAHAELARREAAILEQKRSLSAQAKELGELRQLQDLAAKDPLAILKRFGLSYEGITERVLELQEGQTPEKKADTALREIEAFRQQQAASAKAAAFQTVQSHVTAHLTAAADKYEHINSPMGQYLGIPERIARKAVDAYNETGLAPDLDELASQFEQELENHIAKPVLGLKKYKPAAAPTSTPESAATSTKVGSLTLSNRSASEGPPSGDTDDVGPLDPRARSQWLMQKRHLWNSA